MYASFHGSKTRLVLFSFCSLLNLFVFGQIFTVSGGETSVGYSCSGSDGSCYISSESKISRLNTVGICQASQRQSLLEWSAQGGYVRDDSFAFQKKVSIRDEVSHI